MARFTARLEPIEGGTFVVIPAAVAEALQWGDPEIAIGFGITAVLAVISVWIAARTFARANA